MGHLLGIPRKAELLRPVVFRHPSSLPLTAQRQPLVPPYIILLSTRMDRDQADIISPSEDLFSLRRVDRGRAIAAAGTATA